MDFTNLLQRCRNPKCRSKLPTPTDNPHKAFCTKGCYGSFYLKRCLVCENDKFTTRANRLLCKRPKCENDYRQNRSLFAFPTHDPLSAPVGVRNAHLAGIKTAHNFIEPWRLAAGSKGGITANQYHCATVPDGPDCEWAGGEWRRIEERNRTRKAA